MFAPMQKFYNDILDYAQEIVLHPKCKCILWNNRLINVGNKSFFLKNWYEKELYVFMISLIKTANGYLLINYRIGLLSEQMS